MKKCDEIKSKVSELVWNIKYKTSQHLKKKLPRRINQFLRRRYLKKHAYDFSYLSFVWDLDVKKNINDCEQKDCDVDAIKKFLYKIMSYCYELKDGYFHKNYYWTCEEVVQDLRVYLKYLGRYNHTYKSGVWREISKIRDDWTIIQLTMDLIGHMWD